jgi:hypothetical protein
LDLHGNVLMVVFDQIVDTSKFVRPVLLTGQARCGGMFSQEKTQ